MSPRLPPTHIHYGVHMAHCGPLNDGVCKYGEDDVCPALPSSPDEPMLRIIDDLRSSLDRHSALLAGAIVERDAERIQREGLNIEARAGALAKLATTLSNHPAMKEATDAAR